MCAFVCERVCKGTELAEGLDGWQRERTTTTQSLADKLHRPLYLSLSSFSAFSPPVFFLSFNPNCFYLISFDRFWNALSFGDHFFFPLCLQKSSSSPFCHEQPLCSFFYVQGHCDCNLYQQILQMNMNNLQARDQFFWSWKPSGFHLSSWPAKSEPVWLHWYKQDIWTKCKWGIKHQTAAFLNSVPFVNNEYSLPGYSLATPGRGESEPCGDRGPVKVSETERPHVGWCREGGSQVKLLF